MLREKSDDAPDDRRQQIHVDHGHGIAFSSCCKLEQRVRIDRQSNSYGRVETGVQEKASAGWSASFDAVRSAAAYNRIFRHITADLDPASLGQHRGPPLLGYAQTLAEVVVDLPPSPFDFELASSGLVNELLLVLLDVKLASKAGIAMHQYHEDYSLWSLELDRLSLAWSLMQGFAKRTGLGWNAAKSGFTLVRVHDSNAFADLAFPSTVLKWDVLELQEDGTWRGNEKLIQERADALRQDLANSSNLSFLSVVNLWNKYQAYLAWNIQYPESGDRPSPSCPA